MNQYTRPTVMGDLEYVAAHMRPNDVEEVRALGFSPLDALTSSYDLSPVSYTLVTPDGDPCAVLGVGHSPFGPDWGAIWLLGTDGIERFPKTFLRHSEPALDQLFEQSGKTVLYNYSHHLNDIHHKWLQWLGFRFIGRVLLPPFNIEFIEFAKIRG